MIQQEVMEKNLSLEQQFFALHANIEKLCFQLCQKNMHKVNLQRTYLSEKKERILLDNNKILTREKELREATKLANKKLKESVKALKILHRD